MHYHIVGTTHVWQKRGPSFKQTLASIIGKTHTVLIAEEIDVNQPDSLRKSMGRELANEQTPKIPWLPINMTSAQEKAAGIFDALEAAAKLVEKGVMAYPVHASNIRENYWLDSIEKECQEKEITDGTVLIVCGRIHLNFLADKALQRGVAKVDKSEYPNGLGQQLGKIVMVDP